MVTGATTGLGRVTAEALAAQGATVVLVARSQARGETAVREIHSKTQNQAVHLLLADLASQASIRELAANFKKQFSQLHVLVNNAGAINMQRLVTVDGYETTFATNHLAYFLLTNLLLDTLKASAPARIVNVSSGVADRASILFDDLQSEKSYNARAVYGQSKLANILFTVGLAKRLQGTRVTVNTLRPGIVATGFGRNNGWLISTLLGLITPLIALSPEKGAATQIYLATSPDVSEVSGRYFDLKHPVTPNPLSQDDATVERLWQISEQLTGLQQPAAQSA